VTLLIPPAYAALWLLISTRLPHRDATWRDLVPGAIGFGLGVEVLHVVTAYVIAPQASSKQGTYGALGVAAALLLGLFLISRLVVATAVVNATLVARRTRSG
jgi:membrane protein